jgi:hypothetical protein
MLKHATLVYADTPDPTFDLLQTGRADAWHQWVALSGRSSLHLEAAHEG